MRRVSIYRRKGRGGRRRRGWTIQYYDSTGRRLWLYAETKEQAKDEADRLQRIQRATEGLPADVLLNDYAALWWHRVEKDLEFGTAHNYAGLMNNHLLPALGHLLLREITTSQVKDMLAAKRHDGLARKTIRNIRGLLHTVFEEALDDGIVVINPVAFRSKRMRLTTGREKKRPKAMTLEQLQAFSAAVEMVDHGRALQFRTMWSTGIRPGEALALQWQDLHVAGAQLTIERSFTRSRLKSTKSGRERTVDVPERLVADLEAWGKELHRLALARGEKRSPWMFPSKVGTPVDLNYVEQDFKKVIKAARLPHFTPHCLRHTYASLQLVAGVSIYYVQRQLGHATIQMTVDTYGSWLPAGNAENANKLEDQVEGTKPAKRGSQVAAKRRRDAVKRG